MIRFSTFLTESNYDLGAAYETATALHLHHNTASRDNHDPEHVARVNEMKRKHAASMSKLTPEKQKQVTEYAKKSAESYLKSLKQNHGIDAHDVHEVHHTYAGIDKLAGKKVDQASNPHDVMVKTKDGKIHGASLKFKPGTLSNQTTSSYDAVANEHGIKTSVSKVWDSHKEKAGLKGKSGAALKAVRDDADVKKANTEAQKHAAAHHAEALSKASTEQLKKHLQHITKSNPDVDYDYVVGSKGSSEPVKNKKVHNLINNAKHFTVKHNGSNLVSIHDHEGNHLLTFEHRPTHGAFNSIQVNAKYGTGKAK